MLVAGMLATVALARGVMMMLTCLIGWCSLYPLLGMTTHPIEKTRKSGTIHQFIS